MKRHIFLYTISDYVFHINQHIVWGVENGQTLVLYFRTYYRNFPNTILHQKMRSLIYDYRLVNTCWIIWHQCYHKMRTQREADTYYATRVFSRTFRHQRDRCEVNQEINYLESLRPFTKANSERALRKHRKAQKVFLLRAYFFVWRKRAESKVIQSYEESDR